MPNESPNHSLLQSVLNMMDTMVHEGNGYDILITTLSLLCLLQILSRTQATAVTSPLPTTPQTNSTNPLQTILGELTKNTDPSGNGPSPDLLMSLLPLLNNPQLKSKLNPSSISTILGLMNTLGGNQSNEKPEKKEAPPSIKQQAPPSKTAHSDEEDKKDLGRSLNWKTHFQGEKEV